MGDERSYSNHMRLHFHKQKQIPCKVLIRLPRKADHETRSYLIAYSFQTGQALEPAFKAHSFMYLIVEFGRSRFMPQEIPVRSGFIVCPVCFFAFLLYRKSHCRIRKRCFYGLYYADHGFIVIMAILAALEHERAVADFISSFAAFDNLLFAQAVSVRI